MNDYLYTTDEYHADNTYTMEDYLLHEMNDSWEVLLVDGSYAEIKTKDGIFKVQASGDGDSFNHRISFKEMGRVIDDEEKNNSHLHV